MSIINRLEQGVSDLQFHSSVQNVHHYHVFLMVIGILNFAKNMFEREKFVEHNVNAVAAGRVHGVDPIEQITKRCIRIVKNIETHLSGCVLCRKSGFGPRIIILCDQCEKEFHVGRLKDHKMAFLKVHEESGFVA